MATLEELATQWEDALSTSTGTTIAPGTISPVGATVGGKKTLSWPEVVKRIQENTGFGTNEYMPQVPTGISASNFWKAGVKSGLTPSGLATFTKPPFSGFASRTNPYVQSQTSAANQAAAVAAQTQLTPVRGNVQPTDTWTGMDEGETEEYFNPTTLPSNITFMPSISGMLGQIGSAMIDNLSGKTQAYNDLTLATPEQMENLYNNNEFGDISTKEGRAKADNIVESWRNGQMIWDGNYNTPNVDMITGKGYTDDEMSQFTIGTTNIAGTYGEQPEGPIDSAVNKYITKPLRELFGDDIFMSNQEKYAGKTGYQEDGTFIDQFGNVSAGGLQGDWEDLVKNNPEQAARIAQVKGIGYFGGLSQANYDLAINAGAAARAKAAAAPPPRKLGYIAPNLPRVSAAKQPTVVRRKTRATPEWQQLGDQSLFWNQDPALTFWQQTQQPPGYGMTKEEIASEQSDFKENIQSAEPNQQQYLFNTDSSFIDGSDIDPADEDMSGMFSDDEGEFGGMWMASGGQVGMANGGEAPQMPMPQQPQGVQGDIENLGMINELAAAQPQNGGQQSVKDDIPREADAGDYILPYETVLLTGLNQLNRYAREAVKLAMENDINLKGTDIDPTDDVPIKVSNYEYHIPKILVPFFGGGKKYLDKIREEGLALRKRLEEEKQPSMQEQQPMEQQQAPQPQMVADAQPAPQAPQMPMMAEGGFVDDPVKALKSAEQALTSDASQPTQSAYNQVQALEQARRKSQQPPMVDPTGKVVQQGFAAPQGFKDGTPEGGVTVSDAELEDDKRILQELEPADLFALIMKSEIKDDENAEEQAKHFGSMVMNRVRDGSFGGKDLKKVLLKEGQFAGINFKKDKNHRENFKRAIRGTKVDDPYFLKYKAIANQLINRKLPDPTGGAVWVLNKKGYAKEQGIPEGSLPDYLVDVMETKQVGDLSYFNRGPKPQMKPQPPNLPAIEKAYNKGGFIEAAA